ncbi:MAG: AraC family transcriptional regulator [Firmicutes bacterium]|nr:AraC family transcriptional regulator [Bacillota bacterium]
MANYIYKVFPNNRFIDLGLFQFGYEKCNPSHSFGPATRSHYLFHYVISGKGRLYTKNSKGEELVEEISAGQGFMIFPGQETFYSADSAVPWEYLWLEFDGLRVYEGLKMIGISVDNPVYKPVYKNYGDTVKNEMQHMVDHRDLSPLYLIGHLYLFYDALICSVTNTSESKGSRLRDFYIHEAITFIETNYYKDISVEDIAAACGLDRSYFGKLFKSEIGQSPQTFLITYRMIKATDMLMQTRLSIAEIGRLVGYENQMHFSRAFKNYYGLSPLQWKNAHKNENN